MKIFLVTAFLAPAAYGAEHYVAAGAAPTCEVDGAGKTHVYYSAAQHPSFKCTHAGAVCSCTLKHPTHDKGGCKQLESKAAGKLIDGGGDCTNSGKNTPAPTAAPTAAPWAGSDLAADVGRMADGATINLAAGTFAWKSQVACNGKTLTLTGAGKTATVLDAGGARRFFSLGSGCSLSLRGMTLHNGKSSGSDLNSFGGAINVKDGASLDARDVEFKDNSAPVRAAPPHGCRAAPPAPRSAARRRSRASAVPSPTPPRAERRRVIHRLRRQQRHVQQLLLHQQLGHCCGWGTSVPCRAPTTPPRPRRARRRRSRATAGPSPPLPPAAATPPHLAQSGGAVFVYEGSSSATFLTDLPANSFSGNTARWGPNCQSYGTITGTCG
jgi:hypothetical protein